MKLWAGWIACRRTRRRGGGEEAGSFLTRQKKSRVDSEAGSERRREKAPRSSRSKLIETLPDKGADVP
jgi:hypothetical protein